MPSLFASLALFAYFVAALWQARELAKESGSSRGPALLALPAVLLHAIAHIVSWRASGGIDLHFFTALSLIGLGTAALTAWLALSRPIGALGVTSYPIAMLTLALYAFLAPHRHAMQPLGWQIQLHAGLALLAYAALSLAALLAIGLWFQERALRQRRFSALLRVFPPLTLVEALMFRLIFLGFALLTLALMTGAVFVENLFAQHLVHKTVLSLLAWGVFGALLFGRVRYGWRGKRAVRLALTAMVLLGMAFFGSKFVLELVLARGG